jgi:type III restriction enzyme
LIDNPILNSPFRAPTRHFALDEEGAPTGEVIDGRRISAYVVPVAAPRHRRDRQVEMQLDERGGQVTPNDFINELRRYVAEWRGMAQAQWGVTHETERLLMHWRDPDNTKPLFFCQLEAVETVIWLTEVAPKMGRAEINRRLKTFNAEANPDLFRIAMKMATGSGKTMVMAMLIAWHAVNRARHPSSRMFSDAFLLVSPGITIKDRLRVLLPSDPENYYETRSFIPRDMLDDVRKARIVITNYHALKRRDTMDAAPLAKAILQGRDQPIETIETEGQMLQRVCAPLLGRKEVIVINDEAHHCYRERQSADEQKLDADEKKEAKRNAEAARLWISGIEALNRVVGVRVIYDLSATPFFLRGSGYPEGTLFPWVVSDFSLMDAIESGVVKVPRLPVSDNQVNAAFPAYRNLYQHIKEELPKKGRAKQKMEKGGLDPEKFPLLLQGALQALYGDYQQRFAQWEQVGAGTPPVFIVVCNNTSTSKLVCDHIAGHEVNEGENIKLRKGALPLFSNVGDEGKWLQKPRTLLVDSEQLDSGEALSPEFRKAAAGEIEAFRRELRERFPGIDAEKIDDETLLREAMNTVGKPGRLGENVRCVVSVSMLTEGWDANTVTHILGVRAFGTQLLCEQVVGRGLRRVSYEADADGFFEPEYAEVLGIPFTFVATNVKAILRPPKPQTRIYSPEERREKLTLHFPRVTGYRLTLPPGKLTANFSDDSRLTITPDDLPTEAELEAIVGEGLKLTLDGLKVRRVKEVAFHIAGYALRSRFRDEDGNLKPYLFPSLLAIAERWLADCLACKGGTFPQLLLWRYFADMAAERIYRACVEQDAGPERLRPILDPYNREGSTRHVDFQTTKGNLWKTRDDKSPINFVVCDSDWEAGFARQIETMPEVLAYAKNQNLGFEVPYQMGTERRYLPDFVLSVDDGDPTGPLNLIVEIKGYRGRDAAAKADTMKRLWIPAVNNHGGFGRWSFLEMTEQYDVADTIRAHLTGLKKRQAA